MRPGSKVTITFDDGTVFRGQLGNYEMRPPERSSVEYFGSAVRHQVVTRPASLMLEVYASQISEPEPVIRYPDFPMDPAAPLSAPEPEDVPAEWGAYA